MARAAPAARRALEILDFFATRPADSFYLSELSRTLDISPASLLALLQSLTESGYVLRHARHKTYRLGPKAIAIGYAALQGNPVVERARVQMTTLAKELASEVVATAAAGDAVVVLATAGRPRLDAPNMRVGQQIPLLPPIGLVFLAWSDPSEIEAWERRRLQKHTGPSRAHLHAGLAATRRRGYSVGLATEQTEELRRALERLAARPKDLELRGAVADLVRTLGRDYELLDARPRTRYAVANIAAPVFGPDGDVVLALTVNGLGELDGEGIARCAERISGVARLLTKQSGGQEPEFR